jgi:hypothetical protein
MPRDGTKNRVEELQHEAQGAIGYPELVALASDVSMTPNRAQSVAASRWPRRQARATYFLAKLRRDFPEEFAQLASITITPTEHARPQRSEHARGDNHGDDKRS